VRGLDLISSRINDYSNNNTTLVYNVKKLNISSFGYIIQVYEHSTSAAAGYGFKR